MIQILETFVTAKMTAAEACVLSRFLSTYANPPPLDGFTDQEREILAEIREALWAHLDEMGCRV